MKTKRKFHDIMKFFFCFHDIMKARLTEWVTLNMTMLCCLTVRWEMAVPSFYQRRAVFDELRNHLSRLGCAARDQAEPLTPRSLRVLDCSICASPRGQLSYFAFLEQFFFFNDLVAHSLTQICL
jgi:hypothetical protein